MKSREIFIAYFLSGVIVTAAILIVGLISAHFSAVPLETSEKILENTIQLDGLLFGFTAVMFTLIYGRKQIREKETTITVFLITSFLCYVFSLGIAFSYLMQQATSGDILIPVGLAIVGAVFSSFYLVMVLMEEEKKKGETAGISPRRHSDKNFLYHYEAFLPTHAVFSQ